MSLPTVLDYLLARADSHHARVAYSLAQRDEIASSLTWGELVRKSLVAASCLARAGLRPGDRVIVCLPTGEDLLSTIFGVLFAGGVCVPSYPLSVGQGLDRWKQQMRAIIRVAQVRGAVIGPQSRIQMAALLAESRENSFVLDPSQLRDGSPARPCPVAPGDLAFVQFTSGTTRAPRGVAVSHGALSANVAGIVASLGLDESIVSVSWLPPYHDMGLVGHVFAPAVCGAHQVLLPTNHFLVRPLCWLQLVSRLRANQTTAPNTGYSICVHRIPADARAALDLSCLRQALVGAEPVLAPTLDAFADAFEPCGFPRTAFRPVYGLAESTLAVAVAPPGGVAVDYVSRSTLSENGTTVPARKGSADALPFVAVGHPLPDHQVRVVDSTGVVTQDRRVGEIQVRGPSVMQGYFNDPIATRDAFDDGWLRSGDLGYLADGLLFVTGRIKDLVIKAGRNYVPADIEAACEDDPAIRRGRVVAFGVPNPQSGTEDVVIVAEARDPLWVSSPVIARRITALVTERAGVRPDCVEVVAPGVLPKTSSGKLQRARVKAAWQNGTRPGREGGNRLLDNQMIELVRGRAFAFAEIGWSKAREWLNWR